MSATRSDVVPGVTPAPGVTDDVAVPRAERPGAATTATAAPAGETATATGADGASTATATGETGVDADRIARPGTGAEVAGRWARRAVAAAVTAVMLASPFLLTDPRSPWSHAGEPASVRLYLDGVSVDPGSGDPGAVPAGTTARYLPGSRVLEPATDADAATVGRALRRAAASRAWLAAGTVPGAGGPYEDLARDALLDLHALVLDDGAAVAGWSPRWRYVWPRDSSFVAVALARTGHVGDAVEVLTFLQRVQHRDGSFEARYLPDGSGPPDARGLQADGAGWALWATRAVLAEIPTLDERARTADALRPLLDRSTGYVLKLTAGRDALPPPSSDYWEVRESRLTLGTAAPLLAGLHAAAGVYADLDEPALSRAADRRATALGEAVVTEFGPHYPRYADGRDVDAAGAFLLPPFQPRPLPGALAAWRASPGTMSRPAGGLAPGAGWRDDGVSWTPQTTLYALVAAAVGDTEQARSWLSWVDAHRTSSGAIPEKVLTDGSPAAVAPLTWSAACVLLALDTLGPPAG